jgi:anti-sigma factor RsiW
MSEETTSLTAFHSGVKELGRHFASSRAHRAIWPAVRLAATTIVGGAGQAVKQISGADGDGLASTLSGARPAVSDSQSSG